MAQPGPGVGGCISLIACSGQGGNGNGGKGGGGNGDGGKGGGGNGDGGKGGGGGGGGGAKGGGGGNKKPEGLQPHPVKEQLPGVQYCINSPPPWPEALLLGFQHYILTLGVTVLLPTLIVPQMGGGDAEKARVMQTLLFTSGFTTFFQTLFGTRLPSVAVSSYAYIVPITSVVLASRNQSVINPHERFVQTMRAVQGSLIIAGCFQMVMGFLGLWRNAVRFFTPLSVAPFVTLTGLGFYYLAFPMMAKCIEIGLPEVIVMIVFSLYLPQYLMPKRPIYDRFGVLFSVSIAWLLALILTASCVYNKRSEVTQMSCRTDRAGLITSAPWVYIPYPFQWGSPTFNPGEAFAVMVASFVSLFETTGTFYTTARYGSATPVPPSVIGRGIGWLGLGVFLNGIFGCVTGFTASVENAGLLALTRVGSRRVIQISAGFMVFFSLFGKFGAFFASIPLPIVAGVNCVLYAYASSAGLGFLQFCNLNSFRTKFILGFSFFMGFAVPNYFRHYYYQQVPQHPGSSRWFGDVVAVVFMSHATVAALVALFFDSTIAHENDESAKDSGVKWWEKFSIYSSDVRNDEFYALPCNLNNLFPAL